ncbi:hypothetical protein KPP03845_100427 [Streptomyces xanthophaeus]|uniref:hypothetical protein n=1 Tax=Streptomyces xanthophaeus TaxID=67385 RepID=UPI00233F3D6E|nr:hypothetical protein [Streptomyces xanthophaeus]WCD84107.1 hypothetical protein KPP03845_100427 [Streptomyces xanthophaeus]
MNVDLSPVAILRSAGVPASVMDRLIEPELCALLDTATDSAALDHARSAVAHADRELAALCHDPVIRDAAAVANADIHDNALVPFAEGAVRRRRKRARSVVALLQRLATKNDTAGGYGPMDLVRFGGVADLARPPATSGVCAERAGLVSWWVADLLAAAIRSDPAVAPLLPHRLASGVGRDGDHLLVGDRRIRISAQERAALASSPAAAGGDALPRLRRAGLVGPDLPVPAAHTDPLAAVIGSLAAAGGAGAVWAERLTELRELAQRTADAPAGAQRDLAAEVRRRVENITGALPERPRGRFYSDRDVLYQEGRGAAGEYGIGGNLLDRLRDGLDPVCRLAAVHGHQRFLDASAVLRERTGEGPLRLLDAMRHIGELGDLAGAADGGSAGRLREELGKLWPEEGGDLDPGRLAELLDKWPASELSLLSPDLMLASGADGSVHEARLVLGELHSNLQTFGLFEHFWPDSGMRDWFTGSGDLADRLVQFTAPRSQGKAFLAELPTRSIEVSAASARPSAVDFADVTVQWRGGVPLLVLPDGEQRTLVPGDPSNPLYLALSPHTGLMPALRSGPRVPELSAGGVVLQREQRRLPRPALGKDLDERFVTMRRWRAAHALPERVFVRVAGQPKPFYVDFRNPLLVDLLAHWTAPGDELLLSPMLPGPDQLWLERGTDRFCAELRISAVVRRNP